MFCLEAMLLAGDDLVTVGVVHNLKMDDMFNKLVKDTGL